MRARATWKSPASRSGRWTCWRSSWSAMAACEDWDETPSTSGAARLALPRAAARRVRPGAGDARGGRGAPRRTRAGGPAARDGVNRKIKARRGSRLAAITCGAPSPTPAQYAVIAEPQGVNHRVLDEDFAIESMAGDSSSCSATSPGASGGWRRGGCGWRTRHGAPPSVPFWNGERPGRTAELFEEVSRACARSWRRCSRTRSARRSG